jgi:hypothetical protein
MPDGSSSAAPVIKPGPSLRRNRVTGFFDSDSFVAGEATAECGAFIFSTPLIPYSRCAIANEQQVYSYLPSIFATMKMSIAPPRPPPKSRYSKE